MMNYDRFINKLSARRVPYPLRHLSRLYAEATPDTIFFGSGAPNAKTFPFQQITAKINDQLSIDLQGRELEMALQYQPTPGYLPLIAELKDFQTRVHELDSNFWESRDLLVTTGSLEGLHKTMQILMNEGDGVVCQEPAYPGVTAGLRPFVPHWIPAVEDGEGICPKKLRDALEKYQQRISVKNAGAAKLIYVNPTGSNPTGKTLSTQRKKDIYKIACDFDLLILEDDPYYFLTFDHEERPMSFLSMDTEGRVLRFDSFSKVLSSGIRLGFVTSPKQLSERIELHMQVSTMHTSALSQVLIYNLLTRWQALGFNQHLQTIQKFYKEQRDMMLAAANKHFTGLAEWTVPLAGMFLWLRILGIEDVREMVQSGLSHNVILVSGHHFMLDEEAPCPYIRASFSSTSQEQMDKGFSRIAVLIQEELKRKNDKYNKINGEVKHLNIRG